MDLQQSKQHQAGRVPEKSCGVCELLESTLPLMNVLAWMKHRNHRGKVVQPASQ